MQGQEHGQSRHGREQVAFIALLGKGEDDHLRQHPNPEQLVCFGQGAASAERDDEKGDKSEGEESGIERIAEQDAPDAVITRDEVEEVVAAFRVELARVFFEDEVLQDELGIRVEPEPEAEDAEGDDTEQGDFRGLGAQPFDKAVVALVQRPPSEAGTEWNDESEGFVEQTDADHETEGEGEEPGESACARSPIQKDEEGQEKPEGFRGGGEDNASVAVGAEEGEKDDRGEKSGAEVAGKPAGQQENECGGGQAVKRDREAETPEFPVLAPVGHDDALPEKCGWLGVALALLEIFQREPFAALGGHAGDLPVEVFVRIGRGVLTAKIVQVNKDPEGEGEPAEEVVRMFRHGAGWITSTRRSFLKRLRET